MGTSEIIQIVISAISLLATVAASVFAGIAIYLNNKTSNKMIELNERLHLDKKNYDLFMNERNEINILKDKIEKINNLMLSGHEKIINRLLNYNPDINLIDNEAGVIKYYKSLLINLNLNILESNGIVDAILNYADMKSNIIAARIDYENSVFETKKSINNISCGFCSSKIDISEIIINQYIDFKKNSGKVINDISSSYNINDLKGLQNLVANLSNILNKIELNLRSIIKTATYNLSFNYKKNELDLFILLNHINCKKINPIF